MNEYSTCAECPFESADRTCRVEHGKNPNNCPTIVQSEIIELSLQVFKDPKIKNPVPKRRIEFARITGS